MPKVEKKVVVDRPGDKYELFEKKLARVVKGQLFTTDATGLFDAFLSKLPASARQHYNCNACRKFVDTYGGLVHIDEKGHTTPAIWEGVETPPFFVEAILAVYGLVCAAKVDGVFYTDTQIAGVTANTPKAGPYEGKTWSHMHVAFMASVGEPGRLMSERREEFKAIKRAVKEIPLKVVQQAEALVTSGALYRGDKVAAGIKWFRELHETLAMPNIVEDNVIWRATYNAPAGYAYVRSSVIGTLFEDIMAGFKVDAIKARFADKMDPTKYRRTTAELSSVQIDLAEKAVAEMGLAPAFSRRYITDTDLPPGATLWEPSSYVPRAAERKAGGFDHLKPKQPEIPEIDIPAKLMTWEKFTRDVLSGAARIQYKVPLYGAFCGLTTAVAENAPKILQWDNNVSWCFPNPAARADEWKLQAGALVDVRKIISPPHMWGYGDRFKQHGQGIFMLLDGARDTRKLPGGGFFIEHMRADLMKYRRTIESHINRLVVEDAETATGFGIGLMAGTPWTELAAKTMSCAKVAGAPKRIHVILVIDNSPSMGSYLEAGRAAFASLLTAIRQMPGEVDVTLIMFGGYTRTIYVRSPLSQVEGAERMLDASQSSTALNDAVVEGIKIADAWKDINDPDTSVFLGIVTDGEENSSRNYSIHGVEAHVAKVQATGRWTIAFAGAGKLELSMQWARNAGIPEGNVTLFEASARGFTEAGQRLSTSTSQLAQSYARGAKSVTNFFGAAAARSMGKDNPVFAVTNKSGVIVPYSLDRWE